MSTYPRDYGKDISFKREYDDDGHQRRRGGNGDQHGHPDRRHGTNQRKENPRRDGERRRDRRDYPEDRRTYGREYDDRRRGEERELVDKAKPNFNPSGLLAAATNTVKATDGTSTVLKYNEPPEARKPTLGWRLYVFKGSEQTELLHIHRQSAYLIGRDRTVADIFIEHPSCSKQHAVIQRKLLYRAFSSRLSSLPFIIDLESTNATHVNDETIPTTRFYELKAGDVIKFGLSNREYVLLHDESA
ncbi:SMAD/FHA domain-containing protein, partial [Butyriboletus roseoflavus]